MVGNIIGDPVRDYVDEQIDLRQKIQGAGYANNPINKSPKVINYLNNRSAWIKMASGVSISGSAGMDKLKDLSSSENNYISDPEIENLMGNSLAKNVILFNTVQSLSKFAERGKKGVQKKSASYTKRSGVRTDNKLENSLGKMYGGLGGNSRGLQPVPGITDISIECINRGSIRKAVVNLKAYNKFQFGIIEILYLRLGYIMMLEWGWDKYISSFNESTNEVEIKNTESTIIENEWFKTNGTTQSEMIKIIDGYRALYKGNYDGFFGKVSNFNWTLNRDNTYDITINLITMGSVIESLQVNLPAINITPTKLQDNRKALADKLKIQYKETNTGDIKFEQDSILNNLGSDVVSQFISNTIINFFRKDKIINEEYAGENYIFLPNLVGPYSKDNNKFSRNKIPPSQRYYIRFGEFLRELELLVLGETQSENNKIEGLLKFDKDIEFTLCNYDKNTVPVSPSKVIFSFELDNYYSGVLGENTILNFNNSLAKFAISDKNVPRGQLLNCYLNLNFISNALSSNTDSKGVVYLYKFLETLCNGINESTGNSTNIEPAIKEDKTIYFLDQNPIKGYDSLSNSKKRREAEIEVYGYNPTKGASNFVKDFNFQTKITPDLLSMISISATAGDSSTKNLGSIPLSKLNKGLINRFEEKINNTTPETTPSPEEENQENLKQNFRDQILTGKATIYVASGFSPVDKGWEFPYKNTKIRASVIGMDNTSGFTKGVNWQSKKSASENAELLSKALDSALDYDRKISKLEEDTGVEIVSEVTDSFHNYELYLVNAFGGIPKVAPIKDIEKISTFDKIKVISATLGLIPISLGFGNKIKGNNNFKINNSFIPENESKWWYLNSNPDFTNQGKNALKLYLKAINKKQYEEAGVISNAFGFIPLDLGITFDGLSGIRIYDKININTKFLPSQYPDKIKFVATKVNHKVSENVWETSISTLSVPKTDIPPYDTEYTDKIIPQPSSRGNLISRDEADRLRTVIINNGYKERDLSLGKGEKELSSGGGLTKEIVDESIKIINSIKKQLPNVVLEFTSGNDSFHRLNSPNSNHTQGKAIDFILTPETTTLNNIKQVSKIIQKISNESKGKLLFLDEYTKQSQKATGPHFHISVK
jgi:hypothetical protein